MRFATTRWSVVLKAGAGGGAPDSRAALETLCEEYWYPLYAYARRRGRDADRARDSVQGFFAHLLEKDALKVADPERGGFRAFLLASFRNHMAHEAERAAAAKRGGRLASLDGEARFAKEPAHDATPERLFDRDWALSLLEAVLRDVRREYVERGREELFDRLKLHLAGGRATPVRETAAAVGMTEGAVRVAVHRLRETYRKALHGAVRDTLGEEEDPGAEVRALFDAVTLRRKAGT